MYCSLSTGRLCRTGTAYQLLAWKEPPHQQFLSQCSCHLIATPACKWGFDIFKTWATAATSDKIIKLAGHCTHKNHMDFRGKRLPDGYFVSAITAEYTASLASAIIDIIRPWVSSFSCFNQAFEKPHQSRSTDPMSPILLFYGIYHY